MQSREWMHLSALLIFIKQTLLVQHISATYKESIYEYLKL